MLWSALIVFLVSVVAGLAYAALRGFALWRSAKRTSATFGVEAARIGEVARQIEHHTAQASAAAARMQDAASRLAASRAQLDVQRAALREARSQVRRSFWFVPGA